MENAQVLITGVSSVKNPIQRLLEYYDEIGEVKAFHIDGSSISVQFDNQRQMARAVSSPLPFSTRTYIGIRPHPDPENSGCDLKQFVDYSEIRDWSLQLSLQSTQKSRTSNNKKYISQR